MHEPVSAQSLPSEALALASWDSYLWVGLAEHGLQLYRCSGDGLGLCMWKRQHGDSPSRVPYITVTAKYLVYFMENSGQGQILIHLTKEAIAGNRLPIRTLIAPHSAPLVIDEPVGHLLVAGWAWSLSEEDALQQSVRMIQLPSGQQLQDHHVSPYKVIMLRLCTEKRLLGAVDGHGGGVFIYDMRSKPWVCLLTAAVDHVRDLQLLPTTAVIFHQQEANLSLWNLEETKTVLWRCEELAPEESVTCACIGPQYSLLCGSDFGKVLGMSVGRRMQQLLAVSPLGPRAIQNLEVLSSTGHLAVVYEGLGLALLDLSPAKVESNRPNTT